MLKEWYRRITTAQISFLRGTMPPLQVVISLLAQMLGSFQNPQSSWLGRKKKKDAKKHNLKVKMEGNSHLLCEHQDVFCAASSSMGCHQMHSLFPLCDVVLR